MKLLDVLYRLYGVMLSFWDPQATVATAYVCRYACGFWVLVACYEICAIHTWHDHVCGHQQHVLQSR